MQSGKCNSYSLPYRALVRHLRSVQICVLVIWQLMTHTIFASSVWVKSMCTMSSRGHCEHYTMKKLQSHLSIFSRKNGHPSAPRGSVPASAEARRKVSLWGWQVDLADELEKRLSFSCSLVTDESELLDDNAISLTSSDPAASALKKMRLSPLIPPALRTLSSLRLWNTGSQASRWKPAKKVAPRGHLDER